MFDAEKLSDASDCFLYFRLWPGFTDPFPVDRFNGIANDQDLLRALDDYALGELARPEIRLQMKQVASTRRKNLLAGLKRQSARRSPAGFGNASVRKRLTKRDWYWPRIRHADRRAPLVCRLGAYLGWWQKRWDESFPFGPRVWFYRVSSQELAEGFVMHLNGRTELEYDGHELEYCFRPRFGFVEHSDTALHITAMRSINAIWRGKVLDIRAGRAALAMGQKAMGIADEMQEALAPAEPSQPVPVRSAKVPLYDDDVHVGMVDPSELTKLCTSLLRQDKRQGTLYRDESGRFIYHVWDYDDNSFGRSCQLMRSADAYELVLKAEQFFVDEGKLVASLAELKLCGDRQTEIGGSLVEKAIEVPSAQTKGEANTATGTREERIAALDVRHRHAIVAFELAENAIASPGERFTREKAWTWVEEHYEDYRFSSKQAFMDYVTQARGKLGENVNQPRRGRSGRSVVRQSEI